MTCDVCGDESEEYFGSHTIYEGHVKCDACEWPEDYFKED